jgi:hypothetical protein
MEVSMKNKPKLIRMNADLLEFLYTKFRRHLGASEEQAGCIARSISMGDRQGKLYQGIGVMEAHLLAFKGFMEKYGIDFDELEREWEETR